MEPAWHTPAFERRLKTAQILRLGIVAVLTVIAVGFASVVWFALDGQPLAGQLYTLGGYSIFTVMTGVLTPITVGFTILHSNKEALRKLHDIARGHPELVEPKTDAERVYEAFAVLNFHETILPAFVGFAWSIIYHIVCDPWILVWVAILLSYVLVKYPTQSRFDRWMTQATEKLKQLRG